jgi:hypothetical protein
MRTANGIAWGLVLSVAAAGALPAQSARAVLGQGIGAYRNLDMVSAAGLLRRSLEHGGADSLGLEERKQALTYLGAAELYRDHRDSAVGAFTRLVNLDPRYQPDELVFPPEVVELFREVRHDSPAIAVEVPTRAAFGPRDRGLPIRLYATTRHATLVTASTVLGEPLDTIYRGAVADSLRLYWTAAATKRHAAPVGGVVISVVSLNRKNEPLRRVDIPVQIMRGASEVLTAPPPPVMLPERQAWGKPVGRLTLGLSLAAVSLLVIPEVTSSNGAGVATASLLSLSGVFGFLDARPGKPLPENVVANEVARAQWRARVAAVDRANSARADGQTVVMEIGTPTVHR